MGSLCMPRASRKLQRTLKNLRVSLLCFILTFLMLRNTIGAGKFGTPAQDFEEIRQHLHYVGLHRRHFRVLAEAVEEEEKHRDGPLLRSALPEEGARQRNAPVLVLKEEQGNAVNAKQRSSPLLTARPVHGSLSEGNVGFQKDLEGSRTKSWDEERKTQKASAHGSYGDSRVLLVTGVQSPGCKNPACEHFLLKSLKNKVDYCTLHGLEISLSFGALDPEMAQPASKLSLLQRTMIMYPHVEWLWWMPNEALFTDMSFKLPMHNYTESNLVLLGSPDNPHPQKGLINLNIDTFLIRNCQWSLDLLRACANLRISEEDQADRLLTNSLIRGPHVGTADQSALICASNKQNEGFVKKVFVEHSAVVRGNWRNAVEKLERIVRQSQRGVADERMPFVTHFMGCNVCQKGQGEVCVKQLERAFAFAEKKSVRSYESQHKSLASV